MPDPLTQQALQVSQEFINFYGGAGGQVVIDGNLYSIVGTTADGMVDLKLLQANVQSASSAASAATQASPNVQAASSAAPGSSASAATTTPGLLQSMPSGDLKLNAVSSLYPSATPAVDPSSAASAAASSGNGLQTLMSAGEQAAGPLLQLKASKAAASGPGSMMRTMTSGTGSAGGVPDASHINSLQSAQQANTYYSAALQNSNQNLASIKSNIAQLNTQSMPITGQPITAYASASDYSDAVTQVLNQNTQAAMDAYKAATVNLSMANSGMGSLTHAQAQQQYDAALRQLSQSTSPDGIAQAQVQAQGTYNQAQSTLQSLNDQASTYLGNIATQEPAAQQAAAMQSLYQGYGQNAFGPVNLSGANPEVRLAWDSMIKSKVAPTDATLQATILQMRSQALTLSPEDLAVAKMQLQQEGLANAVHGQVVVDPTDIQIQARALSNKTTAYEASVAKQVAQIDASKLRTSEITLATSAATAALSGYGLENVVEGMFSKGASTKGILESAGAFVGLALSMHVMSTALKNTVGMLSGGKPITFLQKFFLGTDPKTPAILAKYLGPTLSHGLGRALSFLTSGPGILAITGLIVLLSWLMSRKSPEEQGAETLNDEVAPSVWNTGPVMMITAGTALASMGISLGPTAPMMQTITVPTVQLNQALKTATGGLLPSASERYGAVFVDQASGQSTQVLYLTPGSNGQDVVHEVTLNPNVQFTNPGKNAAYIPFFNSNGSPNPAAAPALVAQQQLLHSTQGTNTSAGQSATAQAGASDKSGTTAVNPTQ